MQPTTTAVNNTQRTVSTSPFKPRIAVMPMACTTPNDLLKSLGHLAGDKHYCQFSGSRNNEKPDDDRCKQECVCYLSKEIRRWRDICVRFVGILSQRHNPLQHT
jgi:hypothetical protein